MRLRSVFLAGCITLALPGLAASGFYAVQAWTAWLAAQAAARGAHAAGEVMRAATLVMIERGELRDAAVAAASKSSVFVKAAAASDAALIQTDRALREAGLPTATVERARETIATIRSRAEIAVRKGSALRAPVEQYNRLIDGLEEEVSRVERRITLASPSVGVVVGLARTANEMRGVAGRRAILLNLWFGGQDLEPSQKDELLSLNGRLAGAWDTLQRGVRASSLAPTLVTVVANTEDSFFGQKEPWYRELIKAAVAGDERPLTVAQYHNWSAVALAGLLPLRDALIAEAAAQGEAAIGAARFGLLASAAIALIAVGLVAVALLALLRSLVEPVRSMTATMTALAAGNLMAKTSGRSRLREIGAMAAAIVVFRDNMASLHRREAELRQTNVRFGAALDNMAQGLCMFDADERLAVVNRRFHEISGLPPERIEPGMTFRDFATVVVESGRYPGMTAEQFYNARRDCMAQTDLGSYHDSLSGDQAVAVRSGPMVNGGWITTYEDVTARRASEARMTYMALHDALTGLPNRVLFREHMEQILPRMHRGDHFAVLCLDLDGFKGVNDTLGHPAGDELLRVVTGRLRDNVRETDLVARLGGDEFAIIHSSAHQPTDAAAMADRLVAALAMPFDLQGHRVEISGSIGVVLADEAACTPDELLRNADIALYRAKAAGRGTWCFFEPGMDLELRQRRELEADLRQALAGDQFEVHYQPLVKAQTKTLTGFEALVRWRHPARGIVLPGEFISLAEEIGLIPPLGAWVLAKACSDAAGWPHHVRIAVNLSPVQFAKGNLVCEVEQALIASRLPAHRLELEITESVLLQDNDATMRILHELRALGVRISMDDFGTGYSSLSYLHRFPFDKIKIDQSFVSSLREKGSIEIVRAVVGLGKALGMDVLAEGVETAEQSDILQDEGCDELQGYLFSKPRPLDDVQAIIAIHSPAKDALAAIPMRLTDNCGRIEAVAYN